MKSTKLVIYGKVQGVNLRSNILLKAQSLGINGYVKNNPDRISVECVLHSTPKNIHKMIDYIKSNPGRARIEDIKIKVLDLPKNKGFRIDF